MFKELFTEDGDRGVSPVIGVILMVAITVILAAVIGAFVLGLGDQVSNNAPQASFQYSFNDKTNVTITHGGGDDIENSSLSYSVGNIDNVTVTPNLGSDTNIMSTGDSVVLEPVPSPSGGETVRVIWSNPAGGSSNTLSERDWPN